MLVKAVFFFRYTENFFPHNFIPTIGVDFKLKTIEMEDGKKVKLQIWDTAGQHRFQNIIASYYKGSKGIIIFYDITYRESFKDLKSWLYEIEKNVPKTESPSIFLVGNKNDLEKERKITTEEGEQFAKKYGLTFFESSAKTGKNVDLIFIELVKVMMNNDPVFQKIQKKLAKQRMKEKKKKDKKEEEKKKENKEEEKNIIKNLKILDKYISF